MQIIKPMKTNAVMALRIPYISLVDEDVSNIQNLPPDKKVQKKVELLKSANIRTTNNGPYLDYVHELQHLNDMPISNDLDGILLDAVYSNPFARRFLMAISA